MSVKNNCPLYDSDALKRLTKVAGFKEDQTKLVSSMVGAWQTLNNNTPEYPTD